jgi:quinol monooxygenase YgiN
MDALPQDMRADPTLATIPDVPTLAKILVDTKRALGAEKLPKPQKNWTDKEYSEFYNALGRPQEPDKYSDPSVAPEEGVAIDQENLKAVKAEFHKLGLTDSQAKGILDYYLSRENTRTKSARESSQAAIAAADASLRKEWGQKYDMNVELAKAAANKFASQELLQQHGNNPEFLKFLANVGSNMVEDNATGRGNNQLLPPRVAAEREIMKLKGDQDFMRRFMKGDKGAVAIWNEQHRLAYSK